MKRFLLLALTTGLLSPIAAKADLGEAEPAAKQTFKIWCAEKKNDCDVTFDGNRLRVNGSSGITRKQIIAIDEFCMARQGLHTYTVAYKKDDGSQSSGVFIVPGWRCENINNTKFRPALVGWSGRTIRDEPERNDDGSTASGMLLQKTLDGLNK